MEEAIRQPCWAACGDSQSIWNGILFTRSVHPPSSSCCRALSPFSVLCKEAWRHSARCSWAPGVRQTCVSCTTSVPFYRWASLSRWTSVSGICAIKRRCGRQKLLQGPLVKEPLCWLIDAAERPVRGDTHGNVTCWVGAWASLGRGPLEVWACGRAADLKHTNTEVKTMCWQD